MTTAACARPVPPGSASPASRWPVERVLSVGACPASLILRRVFAMQSAVYPRPEAQP